MVGTSVRGGECGCERGRCIWPFTRQITAIQTNKSWIHTYAHHQEGRLDECRCPILMINYFRGLKHESFCQTAEVEWVWWPNNKITKEEAATTPTAMLYNCSMANWPQSVGCSDVHQGAAWCLRGSAQICQQQLHHPLYIDRALSSVICSVFSVWSGNISNKNISGCCIITSACSTHCFSYLLWV